MFTVFFMAMQLINTFVKVSDIFTKLINKPFKVECFFLTKKRKGLFNVKVQCVT